MRSLKAQILFIIILGFVSCKKEQTLEQVNLILAEMPGSHLLEMEIDKLNDFYFVSSEPDTSIEVPWHASTIPSKNYLFKRNPETKLYEIIDDDFVAVEEILFDKNNRLWARNSKTLYLREGNTNRPIIELSDDQGLFRSFTIDQNNNIWIGGLITGLYKISPNLSISHYTKENSEIPTNSMTDIHADKNNNIWMALWENKGIMKLSDNDWTLYNTDNSNITDQSIWSLVIDHNNHLWIGCGWHYPYKPLMRFNGNEWKLIKPQIDDQLVEGTVRKLYADNHKTYAVIEKSNEADIYISSLLTYDGNTWEREKTIPEDDGIADLVFDEARKVIWVRTLNKGIFKIKNN